MSPELNQDALKQVLSYDPETGIFVWKISPSRGAHADTIAGHLTAEGYVVLRYKNRLYKAHRLAWLYMTGAWPTNQIDHKDRDCSNNRFSNLREATYAENNKNASRRVDNKSGFKGVSFHKRLEKWRAQIAADHKLKHLGYFDTPELAHEAYKQAALTHHGDFANVE